MKFLFKTLIAFATLTALSTTPTNAAETRAPDAVRQIYNEIQARLDTGGDLIVIANVQGLIEKAVKTIQDLVALAPATTAEQIRNKEMIANAAIFLKNNGFYAINGIGLSVVPRADGQNNIKSFISRDTEAAQLPLWRALVGTGPSEMKCHAYLPKDSVFVRSGTGDIRALWELTKNAVNDIGTSQSEESYSMALNMLTTQTGLSMDDLINSIMPESAISIQLSSTATVSIPAGEATVHIPAPSLLLIIAVKDSTLMDTVKRTFATKLQIPLPEVHIGDATLYTLPIPVPSPVPMQITLATHGNFLLIGTAYEVVTEAITAATQGDGLLASPEFTKAFPVATPNNGIQFVSKRLGQTIKSIRDQFMQQMPSGSDDAAAVGFLKDWMDANLETSASFTVYNLRTGILMDGTSTSSGCQFAGALLAVPAGMMAAIAIPSFVKARSTAQNNACINNLRQIDAAKEQAAMVDNLEDGDVVSADRVAEYIKNGMPVCPSGGTYTLNPIGEAPTCSNAEHHL